MMTLYDVKLMSKSKTIYSFSIYNSHIFDSKEHDWKTLKQTFTLSSILTFDSFIIYNC